ncbi:hypothetical protein QBC43DRAFT_285028 [Cladorrhinum sp. PSN259]|nr:hypothetical protein QBC43DRAFT_285028 [Cladorrhinum sp. PSN259]
MHAPTTILMLALGTLTTAQSCGGSIRCPNNRDIAIRLADADPKNDANIVDINAGFAIDSIDVQRRFRDGERIACFKVNGGGVCAFLEKTGDGLTGDKIKEIAGLISAAGCAACGSVPISRASGQEGRSGILKFDFTTRTCLNEGRGDVQLC